MDEFVVRALALAARPLTVAELAGLRFGDRPTEANRKQVKRAVDALVDGRRVVAGLRPAPDARGVLRDQLVVELPTAQVAAAPAPASVPAAARPVGDAPPLDFVLADWLELDDPVEPPAEYFGNEAGWERWERAVHRAWRRHQRAVVDWAATGGKWGGADDVAAACAVPDEPFDPAEFSTG